MSLDLRHRLVGIRTLIVVGFYFGSAKAAGQQKDKEKPTEARGSIHRKEDKPSGES
jgi:hypothetical protein